MILGKLYKNQEHLAGIHQIEKNVYVCKCRSFLTLAENPIF